MKASSLYFMYLIPMLIDIFFENIMKVFILQFCYYLLKHPGGVKIIVQLDYRVCIFIMIININSETFQMH